MFVVTLIIPECITTILFITYSIWWWVSCIYIVIQNYSKLCLICPSKIIHINLKILIYFLESHGYSYSNMCRQIERSFYNGASPETIITSEKIKQPTVSKFTISKRIGQYPIFRISIYYFKPVKSMMNEWLIFKNPWCNTFLNCYLIN